MLSVIPEKELTAKRITKTEAVELENETFKNRDKLPTQEEKPSTESTARPQRQSKAPITKPTEKQLEVYNNLKKTVLCWDEAIMKTIQTQYKLSEKTNDEHDAGDMLVSTSCETKTGMHRTRHLIIKRGGGIRGFGKKPRGTRKLMVALNDVVKYCYKDEPLDQKTEAGLS